MQETPEQMHERLLEVITEPEMDVVARPSNSPDTTTGMRGLVRCRTGPGPTLSLREGSRDSFPCAP